MLQNNASVVMPHEYTKFNFVFPALFLTHGDSSGTALGVTAATQLWLEHPPAQTGFPPSRRNKQGSPARPAPNIWNVCRTLLLFGVERKRDSVKSFKRNDN